MSHRGFSLLELLITITIVSVLMAIGAPSFFSQIHTTKIKTATNDLLDAVEFTRTRAVFSNKRAVLRNVSQWVDGWEIFIDSNNNGVRDTDEDVIQSHEKLSDVRIISGKPLKDYVSFIGTGESRLAGMSNGGAFQAGTFTICPITKGEGYELILARGGRMRTNKITAMDCDQIKP